MDAMQRLIETDAVKRLKERDPLLFSDEVDMRQKIVQRLGWTDLAQTAPGRLPLVTNLAKALVEEGARDVVLLGMGGSSLAALTMSRVLGSAPGMPRLHVLDTTSPAVVRTIMDSCDRASTFFLLSSKSGTTVEPLSLNEIFRAWMEEEMERPAAGKHFIAITDPGSPLEKLRQREVMRVALSAPATVGGRFSALSMFGLAPSALIGIDLETLISHAQAMEKACHRRPKENPGAQLAAFLVDAYEQGADKVTLVCSERYRSFGVWVEQLVAESTGKNAVGLVPVIEYDVSLPTGFGSDRAVIVMREHDDSELAGYATQVAAQNALVEFALQSHLEIGAEFVRWEYATALAGHLLGINPFDEPNVAQAKETTARVLAGDAEVPRAIADVGGSWVTYAGGLTGGRAPDDIASAARRALEAAGVGDYFAWLAYLPDEDSLLEPLREAASTVSRSTGRAVCLETGPRYLHSTGQLHKGGPNTGVFTVITARDRADIAIPGQTYTLAQLFRAQAEGDLVTLAAHDRRVMRLDLPDSKPATVAALADALVSAST
ncbi:MAG: hypothetical protein OEV43_02815 [Coriobacteriia bacterium]|nr:hypothetical protein [Coriobacteriia bacterium]